MNRFLIFVFLIASLSYANKQGNFLSGLGVTYDPSVEYVLQPFTSLGYYYYIDSTYIFSSSLEIQASLFDFKDPKIVFPLIMFYKNFCIVSSVYFYRVSLNQEHKINHKFSLGFGTALIRKKHLWRLLAMYDFRNQKIFSNLMIIWKI